MRRSTTALLQCPFCQSKGLAPEAQGADVLFGPVRCHTCDAAFPVSEGIVDLVGQRPLGSALQRALETQLVARSYDRYIRTALTRLARHGVDEESWLGLKRALVGRPSAPILDIGCGAGELSRRLAAAPELPAVIGMDVSWAMLEEAVAQCRENAVRVDLVRAAAPMLPFTDATLGAVVLEGTLPLLSDLDLLLSEAYRVLVPKGRFVLTTHLPSKRVAALQRAVGLHPRTERDVRTGLERVRFERIERVLIEPLLILKAEKP